MAKTSKGRVAAEVGTGLIAAAAAGYYFYGSKRAKKHRDIVMKELQADWKLMQKEIKRIARNEIPRAQKEGKKALIKGKKIVKKLVRKAGAVANKKR